MPLPGLMLAVLWSGLTAYVLFGGADFGGGMWDLLAGGTERGRGQRSLVEHSIGPVWEANHVWLIFVIVLMWTGIPSVFAAVSSTLYIPLTLVALGIIAQGAFAFRKATAQLWQQLTSGRALPLLLTSVAAGLASLVRLWRRAYVTVRLTAALAVTGLLWGWGVGQYPYLLPGVTVRDAAATDAVLAATLGALGVGALFLVPSLWWLYANFQREHVRPGPTARRAWPVRHPQAGLQVTADLIGRARVGLGPSCLVA